MKLDGLLTISYPRDTTGAERVRLQIRDEASRCVFIDVDVEYIEWARAQSSLAERPCKVSFYEDAPLGKVREHKTVVVMVPKRTEEILYRDRDKRRVAVAKLFAEHEIDGWEGRIEDTENHHNVAARTPDGTHYRVHFERYVDG